MNGIKLTDYWKFFGSHKFAKGSEVTFFKNGSFAIETGEKVVFYDNNCNLHRNFEKAKVLRNGFILDSIGLFDISRGDYTDDSLYGNVYCCSKDAFITYSYEEKALVYCEPSAINKPKCLQTRIPLFYNVCTDEKTGEIKTLPFVTVDEFETSTNGMYYISGQLKNGEIVKYLENIHHRIEIAKYSQVKLMDCGSYIISGSDGSNLYNAKGVKLLHSDLDYGIHDIGGYFVRYEDKLIVDAKTGHIIKLATNDERTLPNEDVFTPYHMSIYPYSLHGRDGKGFWLESHGIKIYPFIDGHYLVGYWHDERFYFIADSVFTSSQMGQLIPIYDFTEEQEVYKEAISMMLPHR